MRQIPFTTTALLVLLLLTRPAMAAFGYDPFLSWKTLKTEHFHIHFHDGTEELAKKTAIIAERVHGRISKYLSWDPSSPTQVVISDRVDFSNGAATPIYRNTMYLFMSPPDEVNTLEDYDDWLDLLITHEYTHVIHLDKVSRVAKVFRYMFGRSVALPFIFPAFPNVFQPRLFTEGLATYLETDRERGIGRGQSSSFEMMMRMESIDGIKSLRHVNQPMASWPAGTAAYLYGAYFWKYVADTYGEDRVPLWVYVYSGKVMPYMLNSTSYGSLGVDLDDVWDGMDNSLGRRFQAQIAAIKKRGLRDGAQLTRQGYYTAHPRLADNGDLWYYRDNFLDGSWLMVQRKGKKEPRFMARVHGNRFDLHPTAGIVLTQLDIVSNTEYYSDIWHINPDNGDARQLTHGGRYRSAAWGGDGKTIVGVHNSTGNAALHLLDARGKLLKVLWQGSDMTVVGEPDISPDGRSLVAPVWRPDNRWDLELFSLDTLRWRKLTNSDDIEMNPRFSADGKSVLFSADYQGVYNIHRLELQSGRLSSLTNVIGGAFHPDLSLDGDTLVYTGYTEQGYDIFRIKGDELKAGKAFEAAPKTVKSPPAWYRDPVPKHTIDDYSPWGALLPRGWAPVVYYTGKQFVAGAMIAAGDVLGRHNYLAAPMFDFYTKTHQGYIYYDYDRLNPALRMMANREVEERLYDTPAKKDQLERLIINDYAALELVSPILDLDYQWGLHLGGVYHRESDKKVATGQPVNPALEDTLAGLAISFNSSRYYARAISPSDGRSIKLIGEDSDYFGGDYSGRAYIADWQEFIGLAGRHVLAMRLAVARGDAGIRPFKLGGVFSEAMGPPLGLDAGMIFNKRDFALRGYQEGLPQLRGSNMNLAMMEYRFPIVRIERGVTAPPIGIHNLHAKVFVNGGEAWNTAADKQDMYWGGGFEFHTELILGYMLGLDLRIGSARGFRAPGETVHYVGLGASF